jgi:hypothetical protein
MGARRLVTLLSWVPTLFGPTIIGGLRVWRSKHRTEPWPQVLVASSPNLDGDLDPSTGVERVGLACARGTDKACIFRGTQLSILIHESPFLRDGTA